MEMGSIFVLNSFFAASHQTISTTSNGKEELAVDHRRESETEAARPAETPKSPRSPLDAAQLSALELDAGVVIRTLTGQDAPRTGHKHSDSSEMVSEEGLLDCETLSLVSNESESDRYPSAT